MRFPFLDYSTLAKRKQACEAEIAVNAPYAPEIYRGVVADHAREGRQACHRRRRARRSNGRSRCGASTKSARSIVSPAKSMRRLAEALGRAVAAAHGKTPAVEPQPWIAALGAYIDEHVEAFRQYPDIFPARGNRSTRRGKPLGLSSASYRFCANAAGSGFIRRIHGDLHLGNIALIDGAPVLFDAIEFSDIDRVRRRSLRPRLPADGPAGARACPAANIVLNRYLAETRRVEDLDALAALPFFLSMRAAIRAKVTAARMERAKRARAGGDRRAARAYFDFARQAHHASARRNSSPSAAFPAPAKRKLARALAPDIAPMPGAVIVRSDVERKALFGVGETEKLPADAYTREVTDRVYAHACRQGAPHPRRRAFGDRRCRLRAGRRNAQTSPTSAKSAGVPLRGLFLTARSGDPAGPRRDTRRTMLPMPMPGGAGAGSATTLSALDWTASTPPERPRTPWRAQRPCWPVVD